MDTSTLITVLTFLGVLGGIIFLPWLIYCERKKLSMKYPCIGCAVSAVLLLGAMYFVFDESNNYSYIAESTYEAKESVMETNEKRFSREDFVPMLEVGVAEVFGENNYSVESSDELVAFTIWNRHASAIFNRLYQGFDSSPEDGWNGQVDGVQKVATDLQELIAKYCLDDMSVIVNAVDYYDHDKLLVSCSPDTVLFNMADSVQRPKSIENSHEQENSDDMQDEVTSIADEPKNISEPVVEPEAEPEMEPMIIKVNAKAVERALLAEIPKSFQSDSMFFTNVFVNDDNSVEIMIQLDQNNGSKDAAFSLAVEYYRKAKQITENAGGQMGRYDIMVLNNDSPLGDYVTDNGKTYSLIADGKVVSIDAP